MHTSMRGEASWCDECAAHSTCHWCRQLAQGIPAVSVMTASARSSQSSRGLRIFMYSPPSTLWVRQSIPAATAIHCSMFLIPARSLLHSTALCLGKGIAHQAHPASSTTIQPSAWPTCLCREEQALVYGVRKMDWTWSTCSVDMQAICPNHSVVVVTL